MTKMVIGNPFRLSRQNDKTTCMGIDFAFFIFWGIYLLRKLLCRICETVDILTSLDVTILYFVTTQNFTT